MGAPTNLHRDIGRLEGKLDAVLGEMRGDLKRAHSRLDHHDERIGKLEVIEDERRGAIKAARWFWGALTAAIGFIAGLASRLFPHGVGVH